MGYIKHHAIVIVTYSQELAQKAHDYCRGMQREYEENIVTDIVGSIVNEYYSFMFAPDGSKEFWAESNDYDAAREHIVNWLHDNNGYYFIEVSFDEEGNKEVVN